VNSQALEAGCEAARKGRTHYEPTNGVPELRKALADKAEHVYGLHYDPDSEVLVTAGGGEALAASFVGLLNPGDEVMVPDPGFVGYNPAGRIAEGVPVGIPMLEKNGFVPSVKDVTSLVTGKSRVMLLNSPNNPTGSMLSHDNATSLGDVAIERDMIVISDEVYEKIVFDDNEHVCIATLPRMRERTIVIGSFSKTYAMTGLRVGYALGPKELISSLWLVHQYTVTCVDTIAQHIALAALTGPQNSVESMVNEFQRRRDTVHRRLNEIGLICILPKGAFYVFPSVKTFDMSSEAFAQFLLKEAHVMTVPGSAFGRHGEGYIRISFAASLEKLEEALDRIEKALKRFV
jgi:aminotransferase